VIFPWPYRTAFVLSVLPIQPLVYFYSTFDPYRLEPTFAVSLLPSGGGDHTTVVHSLFLFWWNSICGHLFLSGGIRFRLVLLVGLFRFASPFRCSDIRRALRLSISHIALPPVGSNHLLLHWCWLLGLFLRWYRLHSTRVFFTFCLWLFICVVLPTTPDVVLPNICWFPTVCLFYIWTHDVSPCVTSLTFYLCSSRYIRWSWPHGTFDLPFDLGLRSHRLRYVVFDGMVYVPFVRSAEPVFWLYISRVGIPGVYLQVRLPVWYSAICYRRDTWRSLKIPLIELRLGAVVRWLCSCNCPLHLHSHLRYSDHRYVPGVAYHSLFVVAATPFVLPGKFYWFYVYDCVYLPTTAFTVPVVTIYWSPLFDDRHFIRFLLLFTLLFDKVPRCLLTLFVDVCSDHLTSITVVDFLCCSTLTFCCPTLTRCVFHSTFWCWNFISNLAAFPTPNTRLLFVFVVERCRSFVSTLRRCCCLLGLIPFWTLAFVGPCSVVTLLPFSVLIFVILFLITFLLRWSPMIPFDVPFHSTDCSVHSLTLTLFLHVVVCDSLFLLFDLFVHPRLVPTYTCFYDTFIVIY